jgi:hypothetical protein
MVPSAAKSAMTSGPISSLSSTATSRSVMMSESVSGS